MNTPPASNSDLLAAVSSKLPAGQRGVPLVQLVMDYAPGDLAVGEVTQALAKWLPSNWHMNFTSVHSFKTTETGFVVGQLALSPRAEGDPPLIIYANCAPRKDSLHGRSNNEGEGLVYGVLENGVQVVAVNSKYSLSVIKDHLVSLRPVLVDRGGSQFRSRDNFPLIVAAAAQGIDLTPWLGDAIDAKREIPSFKEGFIGYIDSFGNIKTTFRAGSAETKDLQPGQKVAVTINGTRMVAKVATGSFSVEEGALAFSLGSSGWGNRFWEIFQRGGSAMQSFQNPYVGAEIKIRGEREG